MAHKTQFYNNGEWVDPVNGERLDVVNPATEQVIGEGGRSIATEFLLGAPHLGLISGRGDTYWALRQPGGDPVDDPVEQVLLPRSLDQIDPEYRVLPLEVRQLAVGPRRTASGDHRFQSGCRRQKSGRFATSLLRTPRTRQEHR